jgi:hydrophobe/amphiphile efflux-1 (HAE1) family protein
MNFSEPFIRRPIGTTLLAVALFLIGAVAYSFLPVASLPSIDFPVVGISASRPGADPSTMAASVAAPLERRLANIASLDELTSSSSLGSTQIVALFKLERNPDAAARDVQAAINAAATDLPSDLPTLPFFRKANQAQAPVLVIALTSDVMPTSAIYDAADSVIAQRISQVSGVAEVRLGGGDQPAIRIQMDPSKLASMGIGVDQVANALGASNVHSPVGALEGGEQGMTLAVNDQLNTPEEYRNIVVAAHNGAVVKLGDVATVQRGTRNRNAAGWFNGKPAIMVLVTKQPNANVIETVDRVKELLPQLANWIPSGIKISILSDRTQTIRASVADIQRTLVISVLLVMGVVFVFLRRATPVLAAGATVPLSLVGACAAMWVAGYSIDNLSLMALTIAVGFVVDDAIVMIENIESNVERGMKRLDAALLGARQIGFTVISISLSLIAVFIPLLLMPGIFGKLLREFSMTLTFAILISTVISLTVTPMICAWLPTSPHKKQTRFDALVEGALSRLVEFYMRTLRPVIDHPWMTLVVILGVVVWTVYLYQTIPKGDLPQDDIGLINGTSEASADVSFQEMTRLQRLANDIILADPDVADVGSIIGSGGLTAAQNQGRFFVSLKPPQERHASSFQVIGRLRKQFAKVPGLSVTLVASQDLRGGGRQSKAQYQYTLSDVDLAELEDWTPKVVARLQKLPELADVSTDRQQGGLRAELVIDRDAASRMGVSIASIDTALNSAFGQRQDALIYTQRNQYRVVIEAPRSRQRDISDLSIIYVSTASGTQVPLTALAHVERGSLPLVVNHQGVLPSITVTFNLAPNVVLDAGLAAIDKAVAELNMPSGLHADYAGDAANFRKGASGMGLLIVAALASVYIILGVLYESLVHPITIISTLPSAGLGALLALEAWGVQFSIIALIAILLLIGIVKKNGIMLVDFALHAERERGMSVHDAALAAARDRFRPILMTTLSATFGALPLAFATGIGAEMRRPLGIAIVGGLLLSQLLTFYTTPVIYLLMSKLQRKGGATAVAPQEEPKAGVTA